MSKCAPYMTACMMRSSGKKYDILEGWWLCDRPARDTYWCMHNWYHAKQGFTGIADGSGYAGFQMRNNEPWAILSLWANENGKPTVEFAQKGSIVEPFSGEGQGMHVLCQYPWREQVWYSMRIQAVSQGNKTVYEQWVKYDGGSWIKLSAISFPRPHLGFTWDCAFMEDWSGNDLARGCQLKGYYARSMPLKLWQSLDQWQIYNNIPGTSQQNVRQDCDFGLQGKDTLWLQSGGGKSLSPAIPAIFSLRQPKKPAEKDLLQ